MSEAEAAVRRLVEPLDGVDLVPVVDAARPLREQIAAGNLDGLGPLGELYESLHPELVWDVSRIDAVGLGDGVFRGPVGWGDFWAAWVEPWSNYRYQLRSVEELGDGVLVAVRAEATAALSRAQTQIDQWQVYRLRDGRIAEGTAYPSRADALADLGVAA